MRLNNEKNNYFFLALVFSINIFAYQANTTRLGVFYNGGFGFCSSTTGNFTEGFNFAASLYARVSHSFTNFFALELGSGIAGLLLGSTKSTGENDDYIIVGQYFANTTLGAKFFLTPSIFLGAGGAYGFKIGNTKIRKMEKGKKVGTQKLPSSAFKNNIETFIEGGFIAHLSKNWHLELGVRYKIGLSPTFDYQGDLFGAPYADKWTPQTLIFFAGIDYLF